MAKRSDSWKDSQLQKKREARRGLRLERGYNAKFHLQKDAERTGGRASMETKNRYKKKVDKYAEYVPVSFRFKLIYSHSFIRFLVEEKGMPEGYKLGQGHPVPTLEELKEFFRWVIDSTEGRIAPNGRPTMHSMLVWAQEFVPGFSLVTGKEISTRDRADLYYVSSLSSLE